MAFVPASFGPTTGVSPNGFANAAKAYFLRRLRDVTERRCTLDESPSLSDPACVYEAYVHIERDPSWWWHIPLSHGTLNSDLEAAVTSVVETFYMLEDNHPDMADQKETIRELMARYPGQNKVMIEHIKRAAMQLSYGQTIGRRSTPVVSFWMMRDKWKHLGSSWQRLGMDGDAFMENGAIKTPATLQLAYFVTNDGLVCQLAYIIRKEGETTPAHTAKDTLPCVLERKYDCKKEWIDERNPAEDILRKMGSIL